MDYAPVIEEGSDYKICTGELVFVSSNFKSFKNVPKFGKIGSFTFTDKGGNNKMLDVPNGVWNIEDFAFYNSDINGITIPKSVISIGEMAFSGCQNLKEISIPGSVETIECGLFSRCYSLQKVFLEDGVREIGPSFLEFDGIYELVLPGTIDYVDCQALESCKVVRKITFKSHNHKIASRFFDTFDSSYTPIELVSYLSAIEIPCDIWEIDGRTYKFLYSLGHSINLTLRYNNFEELHKFVSKMQHQHSFYYHVSTKIIFAGPKLENNEVLQILSMSSILSSFYFDQSDDITDVLRYAELTFNCADGKIKTEYLKKIEAYPKLVIALKYESVDELNNFLKSMTRDTLLAFARHKLIFSGPRVSTVFNPELYKLTGFDYSFEVRKPKKEITKVLTRN